LEERRLDKPSNRHFSGRQQSTKSSSTNGESDTNVNVRSCRMLGFAMCLVRDRTRGFRFPATRKELDGWDAQCTNKPGSFHARNLRAIPTSLHRADGRGRDLMLARVSQIATVYSCKARGSAALARRVLCRRAMCRCYSGSRTNSVRYQIKARLQCSEVIYAIRLARPSICLMTCFKGQ
jgi:hypothetical protein